MELLCVFLPVACALDYRNNRIPNWLLLFMALAGLGQSSLQQGIEGVFYFLCKTVCVILCMYSLFKIGALGAGDVKLLGVCAGYLPGDKILIFLFISLLIAAAVSLIKMFSEHNTKERLVYLGEYLVGVIRSGSWQLYINDCREWKRHSICMAGPVFLSVLMHVGGVY